MPACKLTKRTIDALPASAERDAIWWDEDLKGVGLKITAAGRKVFLVQYRPAGDRRNPRKYTIGEYGQVTPYQARVEAQRELAERAAGRDPQSIKQATKRRIASEQVDDLVTEFLARHAAQNRTLGVAPHVADKILNHQSGTISGVAAVYQRHEFLTERREAMRVWGEHVVSLPEQQLV
jgi:hypothetical protein